MAGKPSFCCCAIIPPPICCFYPYTNPEGTPAYPETNLTPTIVLTVGEPPGVAGLVMSRSGWKYEGTDGATGNLWEVTAIDAFGDWIIRVKEEEEGPWDNKYATFCLIFPDGGDGTFIEDEFPDTVTLSFNFQRPDGRTGHGSGTLARAGLCQWNGDILEVYDDELYEPENKHYVLGYENSPLFSVAWPEALSSDDRSLKDDPQDSPIGTYTDGGTPGTTTEYTSVIVSL